MKHKLTIIDTDPGSDDAIAIISAVNLLPRFDDLLFISSYGNGPHSVTQKNLLNILSYTGKQSIVVKGSLCALNGREPDYDYYHGPDCLGGLSEEFAQKAAQTGNRITLVPDLSDLQDICADYPEITYISLGPLTNLSHIINSKPDYLDKVSEVLIMGGAITRPNAPHDSEYNFSCDPESVSNVFSSDLPIKLFPFDLSVDYPISDTDIKLLESECDDAMFLKLLNALLSSANKKGRNHADIPDVFPILYSLKNSLDYGFTAMSLTVDQWGALRRAESGIIVDVATSVPDSRYLYNCFLSMFE